MQAVKLVSVHDEAIGRNGGSIKQSQQGPITIFTNHKSDKNIPT